MPNEESTKADTTVSGLGRVQLQFTPSGTDVRVPPGVTVFDAASWNGLAIDSTCGGHGTCKKCKIQVIEGEVPVSRLDIRAFSPEQLADGWRLACVARANGNLKVDVPPLSTRPKAATVGVGRQVILRPAVQKRYVELVEPTLHDQRPDIDRLRDAMDDLEFEADLSVLKTLPTVLRKNDFKVTAVVVNEALIAVEPGDTSAQNYAIGIDLGTTTVVATLLDLVTGTPMAVKSMLNKQQPFGADVISRISATMMDPLAAGLMQTAGLATLNELIAEVCTEAEVSADQIYEIAIAGNATMVEILLGVDPEPVGVAPFITAAQKWPIFTAAEVGIELLPSARVFLFPAFGAYVGGDIVAGVLATGMDRDKRVRLLIDVGTNCEIVLSNGDQILTTAAPAGPAFEAASIACGMRAADGAIEVVQVTDEGIKLGVIGDTTPVGICGSGLVDAVYVLHKAKLIDDSGRFVTDEDAMKIAPHLASRLLTREAGDRIFVLHWDGEEPTVYLSQRDVRELQFAKASIATGWRLLLEEVGLVDDDVQQVLLAGSFGSYLSPASAIGIGLVPKLPVMRIVSAGNVAGEGAKMVLLSSTERSGATTLLDEVDYVELSDRPDFNDKFFFGAGASIMSVAVIACGALAAHVHEIADRRNLTLRIEPINPMLHNRPEGIAPEVEKMILELQPTHDQVAIAYADCGTYGAIDALCDKYQVSRLSGDHCYDVFATAEKMKAEFEAVPGTYVFTDYLVKTFRRSVMTEMGLDRYPELRDDYFHSYKRVLWLAQHQTPELEAAAKDAAELIGLPLEIIQVGDLHLEEQLLKLIGAPSE